MTVETSHHETPAAASADCAEPSVSVEPTVIPVEVEGDEAYEQEADTPADAALPADPEEQAHLLKERGNDAAKARRYKEAMRLYTESVQTFPNCAAYCNRSMCWLRLGDWHRMLRDAEEAEKLEGDNPGALWLKGQALFKLERLDDAVQEVDRALTLHPTHRKLNKLNDELLAAQAENEEDDWAVYATIPDWGMGGWSMGASAARDTESYRKGYPGQEETEHGDWDQNVRFYRNEMPAPGLGLTIDELHEQKFGDYQWLEDTHCFIQWLFPIRECSGFNGRSQALQLHEARTMAADEDVKRRVIKSYELMLDFFGMKLTDPHSGTVVRGDNYEEQYRNLNYSSHNYLRITRMLKCLGEVGLEHLKVPFLLHCADEVFVNLQLTNIKDALESYWVEVLRDPADMSRQHVKAYLNDVSTGYDEKCKAAGLNKRRW
eukprot:NODE_416_length_1524_cov_40.155333_g384_i0.p1 GENE.NODE_416_length_1524_cov_40.155333_g384_i0~~NODE_416_length_1524_cov_40.155333_g384_i0.p1  ORF type:complete len:433 (+),score=69.82 NODE_416_length_1524_cov_40.155333_g384_i0:101-1399(+)